MMAQTYIKNNDDHSAEGEPDEADVEASVQNVNNEEEDVNSYASERKEEENDTGNGSKRRRSDTEGHHDGAAGEQAVEEPEEEGGEEQGGAGADDAGADGVAPEANAIAGGPKKKRMREARGKGRAERRRGMADAREARPTEYLAQDTDPK